MYTPKHFQNNDTTAIKDFIRQNGFGILISQAEGNILATHIPLELAHDDSKLLGHVAKGNQQWKQFSSHADVLAIFSGPHSYISSSWYTHENVPTWNYIAVHVYGQLKIIEGEELYASLKQLVEKYDKNSTNPLALENMSAGYFKRAISGIVGFEITITKIEASYKLSQNRDEESFSNIITELTKHTDDNALQIVDAMNKNRCPIIKN